MKEKIEKLITQWKETSRYYEHMFDTTSDPIVSEGYSCRKDAIDVCIAELEEELKSLEQSVWPQYLYKGKPYSIFAQSKIKIDETWVPVIIYECRYDNPEGKYWVRFPGDLYRSFDLNM